MTTMASQITSLTVVYSTVYSDADQRKHQSSASLAFVWGIHRDRWSPRTKGQLRGKCFHLMTSSWISLFYWTTFVGSTLLKKTQWSQWIWLETIIKACFTIIFLWLLLRSFLPVETLTVFCNEYAHGLAVLTWGTMQYRISFRNSS